MTGFGQPPGGGGFGTPPEGSPPGGGYGPPAGGGGFGPPGSYPGGTPFGPPPGGGFGPPPGGPPQPQSASPMAITSLVLLVVSLLCGLFASIPGAIIAKVELGKIERGESPEAGKTFAQIGFWGNLAITFIGLLGICLYIAFVAMAVGGAAAGGGY